MSTKEQLDRIENYCAIFSILFGGMLLMSALDSTELEKDQLHYCEMVKTFKETDGQYGWPDYKKEYEPECSKNTETK